MLGWVVRDVRRVVRGRVVRGRIVRGRIVRVRAVWRVYCSRPCCSRFSRKICEEENFFKFVLQNEGV